MSITATEFFSHFNQYLELAMTQDIYITRDGKLIAKISKPFEDRVERVQSLFGCISDEMTLEQARDERLGTV